LTIRIFLDESRLYWFI